MRNSLKFLSAGLIILSFFFAVRLHAGEVRTFSDGSETMLAPSPGSQKSMNEAAWFKQENPKKISSQAVTSSPSERIPSFKLSLSSPEMTKGRVRGDVHQVRDTPVATPYEFSLRFGAHRSSLVLPNGLLSKQSSLSVCVWFKTLEGGAILGYQNSDGDQFAPVIYVGMDGVLRGQFGYIVKPLEAANRKVNDDAWHFAVLTASGKTQCLYLDGELAASSNLKVDHGQMTFNQIGTAMTRGWPETQEISYYEGLLNDFRVYDAALGEQEVRDLFHARNKKLKEKKFISRIPDASEVYYGSQVRRSGLDGQSPAWNVESEDSPAAETAPAAKEESGEEKIINLSVDLGFHLELFESMPSNEGQPVHFTKSPQAAVTDRFRADEILGRYQSDFDIAVMTDLTNFDDEDPSPANFEMDFEKGGVLLSEIPEYFRPLYIESALELPRPHEEDGVNVSALNPEDFVYAESYFDTIEPAQTQFLHPQKNSSQEREQVESGNAKQMESEEHQANSLSHVTHSDVAMESAAVVWRTDYPSDSQVEYGTSAAYGERSPRESAMVNDHRVVLENLQPDTLYHFRVYSRDEMGNQLVSQDYRLITLPPPNTKPVAKPLSMNVDEDTPTVLHLEGTDLENDVLNYWIETQPEHGMLSNFDPAAGTVTYAPAENYNGTDSFSFRVFDGKLKSEASSVFIQVEPVNDPPTAMDLDAELDEDTSIVLVLNGKDVDGDALQATVISPPAHGRLKVNTDGTVTYTPHPDFFGTDSFRYQAFDGQLRSKPAIATLHVKPVDDSPMINGAENIVVSEGQTKTMLIGGVDPDGGSVTFDIDDLPRFIESKRHADGTIMIAVKPGLHTEGSYQFRITVTNQKHVSTSQMIQVRVVSAASSGK